MQANLETIGNIERRLNITLPAEDVDSEVSTRLKKLAQTVKMHGFRPGKVPLKVVAQQYGSQVRQEVLADKLQKIFGDAVRDNNLRVAGYPKFETRPGDEGGNQLEYSATFEVYPEIKLVHVGSVIASGVAPTVVRLRQHSATACLPPSNGSASQ